LIQEYYYLGYGFLIPKHTELLKISNNPKVFISRRALKHFVESRCAEWKNKNIEYAFKKLYFAIDHVEVCIQKGICDNQNNTLIYAYYFEELNASLRIVTEYVNNIKQIRSIHFQKYKKATD
jgi:hypothetical protein